MIFLNISKVRIINPQRYLHALHPEAQFYIAVPVAEEDLRLLMQYGINAGQPPRIPIPRRSATCLNDELIVFASSDVIFRCKIEQMQAWELLSKDGVVITAPDLEHGGKERTIIVFYVYYR